METRLPEASYNPAVSGDELLQIALPLPKLNPPPFAVHLVGVDAHGLPRTEAPRREPEGRAVVGYVGEAPAPQVLGCVSVIGDLDVLVGLLPGDYAVEEYASDHYVRT